MPFIAKQDPLSGLPSALCEQPFSNTAESTSEVAFCLKNQIVLREKSG